MKCLISLKTQYSNLGDQFINFQLIKRLAVFGPVSLLRSDAPEVYVQSLLKGLPAHASVEIYSGPVTYLVKHTKPFSQLVTPSYMFLTPGNKKGATWLKALAIWLILRIGGFVLAQVGASYGVISRAQIWLFKRERSKAISFRDATSAKMVGRTTEYEFDVFPDLAFLALRKIHNSTALCLPERAGFIIRRPSCADADAYLARLSNVAYILKSLGYELVVTWQVTTDEAYSRQVAAAISADVLEPVGERLTLEEAQAHYESWALVIGNRLHGLLIAAAYGAVPIAIITDSESKIVRAFSGADLGVLCSNGAQTDTAVVKSVLRDIQTANDLVSVSFEKNRKRLDDYFNKLNTVT